jgi:hypothetical protein
VRNLSTAPVGAVSMMRVDTFFPFPTPRLLRYWLLCAESLKLDLFCACLLELSATPSLYFYASATFGPRFAFASIFDECFCCFNNLILIGFLNFYCSFLILFNKLHTNIFFVVIYFIFNLCISIF